MDTKGQIDLQRAVKENAADFQNAIKDLNTWQRDIKRKEQKMKAYPGNERELPEIRSTQVTNKESPIIDATKDQQDTKQQENDSKDSPVLLNDDEKFYSEQIDYLENKAKVLEEANKHKESGNQRIKCQEYEEAAYCYTKAIELYARDPIFYSNRAIAYWYLEKYDLCIDDCSMAILFEPTFTKAFYRRMMAYESLGNNEEALVNCEVLMKQDPSNKTYKDSFTRISNRINKQLTLEKKIYAGQTSAPTKPIESPKKPIKSEPNESPNKQIKSEPTQQAEPIVENVVEVIEIDPKIIAAANEQKDLGNQCIKEEKFKDAILFYTKAIELYGTDSKFYSNRAAAYLKLNEMEKCIHDCTVAVKIDSTNQKAYFRRMEANEKLENWLIAADDCKKLIHLNANDNLYKQRYSKILDKIIKIKYLPKNTNTEWSQLGKIGKDIKFTNKAPHLRSKKPLKRIVINSDQSAGRDKPICTSSTSKLIRDVREVEAEIKQKSIFTSSVSQEKDFKELENIAHRTEQRVPEDDKPLETQASTSNFKPVISDIKQTIQNDVLPPPTTTYEFHTNWKTLKNPTEQYSYLKQIKPKQLNRLLGTQFNNKLLSEFLVVLSEHAADLPVLPILKELTKNTEFAIISNFMDENDRNAFNKILKLLKSSVGDEKDIALVLAKFS